VEELIRQAFVHVDVIGPHVADGHYDLVGPNGEIILPRAWETIIQPGWSITMQMWPIPGPPPPPPPHHPSQLHFPPTPADSRHNSRHGHHPSTRGGVPPPPPSNWPGGPPPPKPLFGMPGSVIPNLTEAPPPSRNYKEPAEKDQKGSQVKKSSADTDSTMSASDHDEFIKALSRFVKARRVFKVGRMGKNYNRATYQVGPKKEGLMLLNEYGRKLVEEARKVDL
jgi:hypothetical protein